MAQKTVVQLVDDLDGTTSDHIETVESGLDGVSYQIDLKKDNATNLREELAKFVASARRATGRVKHGTATLPPSHSGGPGRSREQSQAIRDWARKNGWDVSDRGRIPTNVIEAFEAQAGQTTRRHR